MFVFLVCASGIVVNGGAHAFAQDAKQEQAIDKDQRLLALVRSPTLIHLFFRARQSGTSELKLTTNQVQFVEKLKDLWVTEYWQIAGRFKRSGDAEKDQDAWDILLDKTQKKFARFASSELKSVLSTEQSILLQQLVMRRDYRLRAATVADFLLQPEVRELWNPSAEQVKEVQSLSRQFKVELANLRRRYRAWPDFVGIDHRSRGYGVAKAMLRIRVGNDSRSLLKEEQRADLARLLGLPTWRFRPIDEESQKILPKVTSRSIANATDDTGLRYVAMLYDPPTIGALRMELTRDDSQLKLSSVQKGVATRLVDGWVERYIAAETGVDGSSMLMLQRWEKARGRLRDDYEQAALKELRQCLDDSQLRQLERLMLRRLYYKVPTSIFLLRSDVMELVEPTSEQVEGWREVSKIHAGKLNALRREYGTIDIQYHERKNQKKIREAMMDARIEDINDARAILTQEQRERLSEFLDRPIDKFRPPGKGRRRKRESAEPLKIVPNSPKAEAAIQAAIREAAGKPTGELSTADLEKVTSLRLQGREITDVTRLAGLTKLETLFLQDNRITDLTPLAELRELKKLVLHSNQISDLTPLAGLTKLDWLHLDSNQISDLTPLAGSTNLAELFLQDNEIADLTPLAGLPNLKELWLSSNQITDVTPLASLAELERLIIQNNRVADVSPLASLPKLRTLLIQNNQLTDLTELSELNGLRGLALDDNQIADLAPLAQLMTLDRLWLANNEISDLTPLAGLTKLAGLSLQNNQISDLTPLAGLTNLADGLYLSGNQISDLSHLAGLKKLASLSIESNQISDLTPIAGLTELESLSVDNNQITDLTPLAVLTELQALWLSGNEITDLTPLAGLTKLKRLYVDNNHKLTKAEIGKLQKALPNCDITHKVTK